jgi:argininosuccinate lyase
MEEGVACLALLMSNVGRLATDLFVWHSWEFGFVEVSDALAGTSSSIIDARARALAGASRR